MGVALLSAAVAVIVLQDVAPPPVTEPERITVEFAGKRVGSEIESLCFQLDPWCWPAYVDSMCGGACPGVDRTYGSN